MTPARAVAQAHRRTWRLRLTYRWLVDGESFEDLTAATGIDVEDLVRQLARRKTVWRRIIRSEAWKAMVLAAASAGAGREETHEA